MSEERAVQQVLAKYVRGTDRRDGTAVATLFTKTGRVEISYNRLGTLELVGELVGRDAITTAVSQMMTPHGGPSIRSPRSRADQPIQRDNC